MSSDQHHVAASNDHSPKDIPSDAAEDFVEGGSTLSGGGLLSRNASPYSSMTDLRKQQAAQQAAASQSRLSPKKNNRSEVSLTSYGAPTMVNSSGNFPAVGSTLGPFFSAGNLGKGTFCSIHKCINMHYFHRRQKSTMTTNKSSMPRLAAAKVEIGEFVNSGILGGEASMLNFLHEVLPDHTVPVYMGHYQAVNDATLEEDRRQTKGNISNNKNITSAIVMEYLVRFGF
jgi:hypothetical protein